METDLKPLLILSPAFPPDDKESTWVRSQQLLVKSLRKCRPELPVIVLALFYPPRAGSYAWNGARVISFYGIQERKWRRPWLWFKVWQTMARIRRKEGISGILSFWCGECALVGHYFGRRHHLPHYCWICGQDARKTNRYVTLIRPAACELVAMSPFLAREFAANHGISPTHIIPNGIEPEEFDNNTSSHRSIDVLGVGSLSSLKQFTVFLEVIARVKEHIPRIQAVIVGAGNQRTLLEKKIEALALSPHVTLSGLTPHPEVLRLMQRSKILLHTSAYEGLSTVALEALYAGAHVVSFCDPVLGPVKHWHIVKSTEAMVQEVVRRLNSPDTCYSGVETFRMQQSAGALLRLFENETDTDGNIAFYNTIAPSYNEVMERDSRNAAARDAVKRRVLREVPPGRVLDFGGGTGLDLGWLTAAHQVVFCEPAAAMREQAARQLDRLSGRQVMLLEPPKTDYRHWQQSRPFTGTVDLILCNFGVLNYIGDTCALFRAFATVSEPGAHLIALVLNLTFMQRFRWHRRNALRSLGSGRPFAFYIPYAGGKQTVTAHTTAALVRDSAPYFRLQAQEALKDTSFRLIHLIRR